MAILTNPRCKICGSPAIFICTTSNEHGSVEEISTCRCSECGLVFVSTILTGDQLNEAYATLSGTNYYEEIAKETAAKAISACTDVIALAGHNPQKRILDIGCGDGRFLQELRDHGYQCLYGHEIPGADIGGLEQLNLKLYRDYDWSTIPSDAFDVVTLLDVAEHVMRPDELFEQCFRMVSKGGYVYFHTPVVTKFDRLMHWVAGLPGAGKLGRVWQRGRTSIFHLQNYTDKSFLIVLSKAGFTDIQIRKRNELSWPVRRYVQIYLCQRHNLPLILAPLLAPFVYPLIATNFFNSNKGIVSARKPEVQLSQVA